MSSTTDAVRLFFGVRISVAAVDDLVHLVESMQPVARASSLPVRWLGAETYHLTLKFIGWTRPEVEPALRDVGAKVAASATGFQIGMRSVGAFPSPKKATVVWAGVEDSGARLAKLAGEIDEQTKELGFAAEARAFHPHVTIARLKKTADVAALLLPFSEDRFRKSRIDRLVLFRSETKPSGAEYQSRAEWPFSVP